MKLLLDQGVPRSTARLLRAGGMDTTHTAEIGLSRADDEIILAEALAQDRVVVTLDADFHALLALSGAAQPSVVRIRIEGLRAEELAPLLHRVVEQCGEDLTAGAAVSVTEGRIRIRKLPLVR